jgi:outer membrane protein OmpA-like peptidoglycan-associated protein
MSFACRTGLVLFTAAAAGSCGTPDRPSVDGVAAGESSIGELLDSVRPTAWGGNGEPPDSSRDVFAGVPRPIADLFAGVPETDMPCPPAEEGAEADSTDQRDAIIPLVVGLTLSHMWMPPAGDNDPYEYECLTQVTAVERDRVVVSNSCPAGRSGRKAHSGILHQLCRADLRDARSYRSSFGSTVPELQSGATSLWLSRRAYRELKQAGATWLRYIEMEYVRTPPSPGSGAQPVKVVTDWFGRLERSGPGMVRVVVNDRLVEVPVLFVAGDMRATPRNPDPRQNPGRWRMAVADDERLPLALEVWASGTGASIRYTKITYPTGGALERELAEDRRATVYGIYFAYNSAEIREESEAVLREIGDVLRKNADWRLRIEGHTDSIGGAAFNQDLSLHRAEAVRAWLVERYRIDAGRLQTAGLGASAPKDRNDTPEGRARNRRVELVRQP